MNIKSIKVGKWYSTIAGVGECLRVGGTFPPSIQMNIAFPFPKGRCNLGPRDIQHEVPPPVLMKDEGKWTCQNCGETFDHRDAPCAQCGGDTFTACGGAELGKKT